MIEEKVDKQTQQTTILDTVNFSIRLLYLYSISIPTTFILLNVLINESKYDVFVIPLTLYFVLDSDVLPLSALIPILSITLFNCFCNSIRSV